MSPNTPPQDRPDDGSNDRTRTIIIVATVVIGALIAMVPLAMSLNSTPGTDSANSSAPAPSQQSKSPGTSPTGGQGQGDGVPKNVKNPVACPTTPRGTHPTHSPQVELAGVELPCLTAGGEGHGSGGDLAAQLAGKPTVINVWAWWCGPCREELPLMDRLAREHPEWNVVGVHMDPKGAAGVNFLQETGATHLASYQDSSHTFDAATGIPKVVPVTLMYHPDGTRADLQARPFHSYEDLENAATSALSG